MKLESFCLSHFCQLEVIYSSELVKDAKKNSLIFCMVQFSPMRAGNVHSSPFLKVLEKNGSNWYRNKGENRFSSPNYLEL